MATFFPASRSHTVGQPVSKKRPDDQLAADRITAALVLLGMIALVGVLVWLSSLSGHIPTGDYDFMMPG